MRTVEMTSRLDDCVARWAESIGIDPSNLPPAGVLNDAFERGRDHRPCRPGAEPRRIDSWERGHGFALPPSLRAWLLVSDGLYLDGPLIHPLTAIGPMIPFAHVPGLVVQPESWFELGNPRSETICIDLAYSWPGGGCPIFTSGDDAEKSPPRLIAPSFETWFLRLLREGGREFWFDRDFSALGDPWLEHLKRAPAPHLPERLKSLAPLIRPLMHPGADDRSIAGRFGISRNDVETVFRYLQQSPES
jgi:hypothetical protein